MGFSEEHQDPPGVQALMKSVPDCGEASYRGSGRLAGKRAVSPAATAASAELSPSLTLAKAPTY
jgi:hypothetical protein